MKFKFFMLVLPLVIVAGSSVMSADTIGGPGSKCASCDGAEYTLSYSGSPVASTKTTQTFQISFDVNDSTYTGQGSFLNSVAIKVAPAHDVVKVSLVSAPSTFSYLGIGNLSAQGCSGGNNSGFLCVESSGNGASIHGGPYDFVYDVTVKTGTLFTALDSASVKALYVNTKGKKAGALMSEEMTLSKTTATPEPSSYLMMMSGLFGVGLFVNRRKAAAKA